MKRRGLMGAAGVLLVSALFFAACDNGGGGDDGGGSSLDGIWSQANNSAIKFDGTNLQYTIDRTVASPTWITQGTYTYGNSTLTVTPVPANGVQGANLVLTAVINNTVVTISGGTGTAALLNGTWTKQP